MIEKVVQLSSTLDMKRPAFGGRSIEKVVLAIWKITVLVP